MELEPRHAAVEELAVVSRAAGGRPVMDQLPVHLVRVVPIDAETPADAVIEGATDLPQQSNDLVSAAHTYQPCTSRG